MLTFIGSIVMLEHCPMFHYTEKIIAPSVFQFQIKHLDQWLTVQQVIDLWQNDAAFRKFYTQILREVPFFGFFWENKPMHPSTLSDIYQFVVLKTTAFNAKTADQRSFARHFKGSQLVTAFPNLSNTAQLVVPCPNKAYLEGFVHLGSFIRNASDRQIDALWKKVGQQLDEQLRQNDAPIWLSTSGLGVYWLHVRLDQHPKYYNYQPYKTNF